MRLNWNEWKIYIFFSTIFEYGEAESCKLYVDKIVGFNLNEIGEMFFALGNEDEEYIYINYDIEKRQKLYSCVLIISHGKFADKIITITKMIWNENK